MTELVARMKLPKDCPFAAIPDDEFDPDGIGVPGCCRAAGRYRLPGGEPPLCRSRESEQEAYRFFWDSSFDGRVVVQVGYNETSITLRWQYAAFVPETAGTVALSKAEWEILQHALHVAEFWSIDSAYEFPDGFDGAQWLIEGRRGDDYNAVHRWSPDGAIHELGKLLFSLSGPPLARVKLY